MSETHKTSILSPLEDPLDETTPFLGSSQDKIGQNTNSSPQRDNTFFLGREVSKDQLLSVIPEEEYQDEELDIKQSPYEAASILNVLHYIYAMRYVCKLRKKSIQPITLEDTPRLGKTEEVSHKIIQLETQYQNYRRKYKEPSIFWPVFRVFWRRILQELIAAILCCAGKIFSTFFLSKILLYLEEGQKEEALKWTVYLFISTLVSFYTNHYNFFQGHKFVAQLKPSLIGLMYKKINRLNSYSINQVSIGKIVNIAANDLNSFEFQIPHVYSLVISPFVLLASLAVLWSLVGIASLSGIIFLFLVSPIQYFVTSLGAKYVGKKNTITDERVKLTNEMIEGIRLLKLYGWNTEYAESIMKTRDQEISLLTKIGYCDYIGGHLLVRLSPAVGSFLVFVTYGLMGGILTASSQAKPGLRLKRIIQLLEVDENETSLQRRARQPLNNRNDVEFDNYSAFWGDKVAINDPNYAEDITFESPTLKKLTFSIERGTLCAIIGRVGSGKTTTLLSFLNEVPSTTGELRFSGRIAYVEQEPIIFPGTLRSNILFGKLYDRRRYNRVVEASCLLDDFKEFANGDMTEIGEKGTNLSGGQKARTSLARALYSDVDIYLLDDPLSAVDTKVAKKIFQKAIKELLKDKTVILVTHQVHFAKEAEKVIVLENGEVKAEGTFEEIMRQDGSLVSDLEVRKTSSVPLGYPKDSPLSLTQSVLSAVSSNSGGDSNYGDAMDSQLLIDAVMKEDDEKVQESQGYEKLMSEEIDESGQVGWATYWYYIRNSGSLWSILLFVVVVSIIETLYVMYTRLIGYWTQGTWTPVFTMKVLGIILIAFFLFLALREVFIVRSGINVSQKLHNKILNSVSGAKVEFFDTNPSGRILNRFSNDVGVLDRFLIQVQNDVLDAAFYFLALFIMICIIVPLLIVPELILMAVIAILVKYLKNPITQGRGIELLTRSPIYSLFSLTLSGLTTIRVYGQENRFIHDFTRLLNRNVRAFSFYYDVTRVFAFYTDLAAVVFICTGIAFLVYTDTVDISLVGLACCYLLNITDHIQFAMRQMLSHIMLMASTARIKAYTEIQQEPAPILPSDKALKHNNAWPSEGRIQFNNVFMRYRENTNHILKGLTFSVAPAEKIGCVGRTGAGKSSIIQALFRLVEIDKEEISDSSITIDGVDTFNVGLQTLRRSISIIPQTSFIFRGTIRKNLDPLGEHKDEELITALQETDLWNYVNLLPDRLSTDMSNSSSLFSAGQKQLLCLARVLLQNNKILVLDEATANVDFETDNFVQHKIMERFRGSTVFTIAHRLSTVAHYDKVLVMDRGGVKELDHPYKLLVNKIGDETITRTDGTFARMVRSTGTKLSDMIFQTAKSNYFDKFGK